MKTADAELAVDSDSVTGGHAAEVVAVAEVLEGEPLLAMDLDAHKVGDPAEGGALLDPKSVREIEFAVKPRC
ncbi:MAG TPA: hypothetical protein VGO40_23035 [Longimicrobium sp.]|nr:hypothetical protein [Longimicrobium sp.]